MSTAMIHDSLRLDQQVQGRWHIFILGVSLLSACGQELIGFVEELKLLTARRVFVGMIDDG
jgi:hypothetical protein